MHIKAFEDCTELMRDDILNIIDCDEIDLDIPPNVYVSSKSKIKLSTVADVLRILRPSKDFELTGIKVSSGVPEQPIGQQAILGALNRLNALATEGTKALAVLISIENGLFRVSNAQSHPSDSVEFDGVILELNGANPDQKFDTSAEYEDRAVAAICMPSGLIVAQVSTSDEAVRFPREAVHAASTAEEGFNASTAGLMLYKMGLVADGQNPHLDLTKDSPNGPLSRQEQMARVVIRALVTCANHNS